MREKGGKGEIWSTTLPMFTDKSGKAKTGQGKPASGDILHKAESAVLRPFACFRIHFLCLPPESPLTVQITPFLGVCR